MSRKLTAFAVLTIALQVGAWCVLFMLGAFGREIQMEHARVTWEGVRRFATVGTLVVDGIVFGVAACAWSIRELTGAPADAAR